MTFKVTPKADGIQTDKALQRSKSFKLQPATELQ
jgi:hypothetical protein